MKKKPISINIIALGYLLAPLGNLIQMSWINNWPITGPRSIFYRLSYYEMAILACFPIVAYGIYKVAKWGYFVFLGFSALVIAHNTYAYFTNTLYSTYIVVLFQAVTLGVVGYFLQKHIISPYFNPNLKWWERDDRFRVNLGAQLNVRQTTIDCQVLDLSKNGCYVGLTKPVQLGDTVLFNLQIGSFSLTATAQVMWVRKEDPAGYGLLFMNLTYRQRRTLLGIMRYLEKSVDQGLEKSDGIRAA